MSRDKMHIGRPGARIRRRNRPQSRRTGPADANLADRAYELILGRILSGALPFGAPISRREVARELGMSVLPVTAALQRLEHEHLVESVPRAGTIVRVPTPQDIRGFYVVREALEVQTSRLCAQRATPRELEELKAAAAELDQQYGRCVEMPEVPGGQLFELRRSHMRFHRRIAELAGCPYLLHCIDQNQILVFNWFYDRFFGKAPLPEHWHEELVEALASGDPDLAEAAMRKHVQYQLDRLIRLLEPHLRIAELSMPTPA